MKPRADTPAEIIEIVLTGGSCGGKTSALGALPQLLRKRGIRVLPVPEVATMLVAGGVGDIGEIAREDSDRYCQFQHDVFITHRMLRRRAHEMAERFTGERVVILFDRGELDGMAFHSHDCFPKHAAAEGTTIEAIRDQYAAVMHLVTTADGAEDFYTRANNSARWENADEARRLDAKIMNAWNGHRRLCIIRNGIDFPGKLGRLLEAILVTLGIPVQMQIEMPPPSVLPPDDVEELGLLLWGSPARAEAAVGAGETATAS